MKKTICGLLFISFIFGMISCALAQQGFDTNLFKTKGEIRRLENKTIKLDLAIKVDNKDIYDTTYVLNIVNYNTGVLTTMNVSNKFVIYLDYNQEFEISINYKGTNTKAIIVDTESPYDNWYIITGISLNTCKEPVRILAGGIKFDKTLQTFKKYK